MNRCIRTCLLALALTAGLAQAQGIVREAPQDVVHGHLTVGLPPNVVLEGKPDRLSPGARIRDINNMLVMSASLAGRTIPVVYRRDAAGLIHEVWILTAEEDGKLGDTSDSAQGHKRFAELLNMIFGARP